MCGGGGVGEKSGNFREISLIKAIRLGALSVHIGCVSCGRTDWVAWVRCASVKVEESRVGEKSGNFREILLIKT